MIIRISCDNVKNLIKKAKSCLIENSYHMLHRWINEIEDQVFKMESYINDQNEKIYGLEKELKLKSIENDELENEINKLHSDYYKLSKGYESLLKEKHSQLKDNE